MSKQSESEVTRSKAAGAYARLIQLEKAVSVALLVTILIVTFGQVIARFVLHSPFFWTEELARYSYVWLSFVASIFVIAERSHIAIQLFEQRLSSLTRLVVNCFSTLAVIVACLMITTGAYDWLLATSQGRSAALGIPTNLLYGVVFAAFVGMGVHSLIVLVQLFQEHRKGDDATGRSTRAAIGETGL